MYFSFQYLASLKWSTPKVNGKVPNARDGHSACVIDGKMYIFGGYEEQVRTQFNSLISSNDILLILIFCLRSNAGLKVYGFI